MIAAELMLLAMVLAPVETVTDAYMAGRIESRFSFPGCASRSKSQTVRYEVRPVLVFDTFQVELAVGATNEILFLCGSYTDVFDWSYCYVERDSMGAQGVRKVALHVHCSADTVMRFEADLVQGDERGTWLGDFGELPSCLE